VKPKIPGRIDFLIWTGCDCDILRSCLHASYGYAKDAPKGPITGGWLFIISQYRPRFRTASMNSLKSTGLGT
jgi:hypothetical protein